MGRYDVTMYIKQLLNMKWNDSQVLIRNLTKAWNSLGNPHMDTSTQSIVTVCLENEMCDICLILLLKYNICLSGWRNQQFKMVSSYYYK